MTLLRKALPSLWIAGAVVLLFTAAQFLQSAPHGYWPGTALKVLSVVPLLPALLLQFWCGLHLQWQPPLLALAWPLFTLYATTLQAARTRLQAPLRPGRRAFLSGGGVVALSAYGVANSYPPPTLTRLPLSLPELPESLEGLRVVLLSDLHRGPAIGKAYLDSVVSQVNALKPDLVLMPGDFVARSSAYYPDVTAVLRNLRPSIASLATLGNHDHWEGADGCRLALERAGIVMLQNRSLTLGADRLLSERSGPGLCLAGVDDLGAGQPDIVAALARTTPEVPTLLLSHNPDLAEAKATLACPGRVDLQLSGHTHGGQVVLPGVGPVVSGSRYGLKYMRGWCQGPRWPVFVTRGVGASLLRLRVGASPEIVLFELQRPINDLVTATG